MRSRFLSPAVSGLACLALMAGGCAADGEQSLSAAPYAAEFADAFERAESDYVRNILKDGKIEAAEFQDAQQHVIECFANIGIEARWVTDTVTHNVQFEITNGSDTDSLLDQQFACEDQWMGRIQALYQAITLNPDNKDWNTIIAACLVREGLVPPGFTAQEYEEITAANGIKISTDSLQLTDGHGSVEVPVDSTQQLTLPGGTSMDDPRVMKCELNPEDR